MSAESTVPTNIKNIYVGGDQKGAVVINFYDTEGNVVVTIDGVNKRIVVNDGSNDRVLIGYDEGGF